MTPVIWLLAIHDRLGAAEPFALPRPWSLDFHGRHTLTGLVATKSPRDPHDPIDVRRARLTSRLNYGTDIGFQTSVDFPDGTFRLREFLIEYQIPKVRLRVGRMLEPFGMSSEESSNGMVLIERSAIATLERNFGLGVSAGVGGEYWTVTAAAFTPAIDLWGLSREDEDDALTVRYTHGIPLSSDSIVHFGLAGSRRWPQGPISDHSLAPETRLLAGLHVDSPLRSDVSCLDLLGLEFAARLGPILLQSEYIEATRRRRSGSDETLRGAYLRGSWAITGETRAYDARLGAFKRIRPKRDVPSGGIGAIELAARYSWADLRGTDNLGDAATIWTGGINWYWNEWTQFSVNYHHIQLRKGGPNADQDEDVAHFRIHIFF